MRSKDSARLDRMERFLASGPDVAWVLLSAWYSNCDPPDGFSCSFGERHPGAEEFPTLREAIDAALAAQEDE